MLMNQRLLHPAMSLDTTLLELAWTVAPAGAAGLVALADARPALAVIALLAATAGLTALRLPTAPPATGDERPSSTALGRMLWRAALPSLGLGLVGGFAGGVLDTAVPPTLDSIGSAASLAGVLFTGYSIASLLGGLAYGMRRWPGRIHRQAITLLLVLLAVLLPAALIPSLPVVAVCVVAAGMFAAPQLTARSLSLQQDLPKSAWSAGFSSLYAANGVGYGLAGFAVGVLLPMGAHLAFAVPLLLCATGGCVALFQSPPPPASKEDAVPAGSAAGGNLRE
ncbi:MFS transporter [Streptomyces sp. V4-01]|uniref:MFS transporter n=1 Tax=Actinacidiphila polyblastidii TaxID=3110430 RepID=A0ABU7PCG1_9ACTN|nr:MFS transporter [Streptomyces sp. V4-01]